MPNRMENEVYLRSLHFTKQSELHKRLDKRAKDRGISIEAAALTVLGDWAETEVQKENGTYLPPGGGGMPNAMMAMMAQMMGQNGNAGLNGSNGSTSQEPQLSPEELARIKEENEKQRSEMVQDTIEEDELV